MRCCQGCLHHRRPMGYEGVVKPFCTDHCNSHKEQAMKHLAWKPNHCAAHACQKILMQLPRISTGSVVGWSVMCHSFTPLHRRSSQQHQRRKHAPNSYGAYTLQIWNDGSQPQSEHRAQLATDRRSCRSRSRLMPFVAPSCAVALRHCTDGAANSISGTHTFVQTIPLHTHNPLIHPANIIPVPTTKGVAWSKSKGPQNITLTCASRYPGKSLATR
jgi:hypothetical protein